MLSVKLYWQPSSDAVDLARSGVDRLGHVGGRAAEVIVDHRGDVLRLDEIVDLLVEAADAEQAAGAK